MNIIRNIRKVLHVRGRNRRWAAPMPADLRGGWLRRVPAGTLTWLTRAG